LLLVLLWNSFIRSAMSDILEIQSDKLIGQETIPVFFGKTRTINVLKNYFIDIISSSSFFLSSRLDFIFEFFSACLYIIYMDLFPVL